MLHTGVDITDASNYPGHADQLFTPETESEVAAILQRASREKVPVTICGALTGLSWWSVSRRRLGDFADTLAQVRSSEGQGDGWPRGPVARSASRQQRPPASFTRPTLPRTLLPSGATSRPIPAARAASAMEQRAAMCSLCALRSWMAASSRSAGARRSTFDVPAISLPHTTKLSAGYPLAPGMEWVDLIVGNEGTLGVVTEAELQLLPAPGERLSGVVFFRSEGDALDAVDRWRPTPGLNMIEYIDRASLQMMDVPHAAALMIEIEGDADIDMDNALENDSWFATSATDRERFRAFRHSLAEKANERVRRTGFVKLGTDYAVPLDRNRDMMAIYRRVMNEEAPGRYVIFGHIGDAHLHINSFPETREQFERGKEVMTTLAREAVKLGGTVGAEHGLGKRKAHLLQIQYPPDQIEAMKQVKRRFDPEWLLGRGTLFAYPD